MLKDAKGNDFVVGKWYETIDEKYKIIEITPSGLVIAEWFGDPEIVTSPMADDMYPEGEYPELFIDWQHFVENKFMMDRRNQFQLTYWSGNWEFHHFFEAIGTGELLVQKRIDAVDYNELQVEVNKYFMDKFKDFRLDVF